MRGEDATWPRAPRERPAANVSAVSHYSQDASRRQRDSGHDGGKEHLPRLLLPPPNPKKQQLRQDSPWDKTFSPPPEIQRGGDREDWRARLGLRRRAGSPSVRAAPRPDPDAPRATPAPGPAPARGALGAPWSRPAQDKAEQTSTQGTGP